MASIAIVHVIDPDLGVLQTVVQILITAGILYIVLGRYAGVGSVKDRILILGIFFIGMLIASMLIKGTAAVILHSMIE